MRDGVLTEFLGAVVQELSKSINFTIKLTSSEVLYGNWNEERQAWTGVIGEVVSGMVDIGVAEFSITSHRMDAVDFTLPLILSHIRVYFKKPDDSAVKWSAYFKVLFVVSLIALPHDPHFDLRIKSSRVGALFSGSLTRQTIVSTKLATTEGKRHKTETRRSREKCGEPLNVARSSRGY